MRKWIWTFGVGTPYAGKYVIVNTDKSDGREYMFNKYGQQNCCMSYFYNAGIMIVERHGYQLLEEVTV